LASRERGQELKALVAYADARGVTIVPELEMPGHAGAAARAMPEIFDAINPRSKQPVGIGCMNMSNEAIYPVLDTLIGEMCDVFRSSPYFHIGSVVWEADGQIAGSANVNLQGSQSSFLDLNGHKVALGKILLSKAPGEKRPRAARKTRGRRCDLRRRDRGWPGLQ
jgi:Glycosyl hydrolase family 20, catalytic domain